MTYNGGKTVAAAGTAERLLTECNPCFTLTVQAVQPDGDANSDEIYIGGSTVSSTSGLKLQPGDVYTFPPQETNSYNVEDIWIDAATSGDGVVFIYSRR